MNWSFSKLTLWHCEETVFFFLQTFIIPSAFTTIINDSVFVSMTAFTCTHTKLGNFRRKSQSTATLHLLAAAWWSDFSFITFSNQSGAVYLKYDSGESCWSFAVECGKDRSSESNCNLFPLWLTLISLFCFVCYFITRCLLSLKKRKVT